METTSILDRVDLGKRLDEAHYVKELVRCQRALAQLSHQVYVQQRAAILVYEGWDAAGKGGNIKRVTEKMDPRGYSVYPISAPSGEDADHHYLWRFWRRLPEAGHVGIFDRSWYGRVLVERVEGLCSEADWKRAYREINEFESQLLTSGAILFKFWLHISPDEQLRRFEARSQTRLKRWKLNEEDWRNREKWAAYKQAAEEMLLRTSSSGAPWTIVEANCKWWARIKVMKTLIKNLNRELHFKSTKLETRAQKKSRKK